MRLDRLPLARLICVLSTFSDPIGASAQAFSEYVFSVPEGEIRDLSGFHSIEVQGSVDLHLSQGDNFRVEARAYEAGGDHGEIVTEIYGTTLVIRQQQVVSESGVLEWGNGGRVDVTLPVLWSIRASDGAEVSTASGDVFVSDSPGRLFSAAATDGADVNLSINVDRLQVSCSEGSYVSLRGSAMAVSLDVRGGSELDGIRSFTTEHAMVESHNGSDVSIYVTGSLVARASGGGNIAYGGNPVSIDVESSRGSTITIR